MEFRSLAFAGLLGIAALGVGASSANAQIQPIEVPVIGAGPSGELICMGPYGAAPCATIIQWYSSQGFYAVVVGAPQAGQSQPQPGRGRRNCRGCDDAPVGAPRPTGFPEEFVVVSSRIDNVMEQSSVFDVAKACTDNPTCMTMMRAASAYFQVPVDKVVSAAALLATRRDGEGTFMDVGLPSGYAYCRSTMSLVSIVPRDGPRGSTFLAQARPNGLYVETWTPRRSNFEGRSWVEADFTIVGVRQDAAEAAYSSGRCYRPASRALFFCRGSGCEGGAQDNGQNVHTGSAPSAGSRNQ